MRLKSRVKWPGGRVGPFGCGYHTLGRGAKRQSATGEVLLLPHFVPSGEGKLHLHERVPLINPHGPPPGRRHPTNACDAASAASCGEVHEPLK